MDFPCRIVLRFVRYHVRDSLGPRLHQRGKFVFNLPQTTLKPGLLFDQPGYLVFTVATALTHRPVPKPKNHQGTPRIASATAF